jgi:ribosome-associated protein
LYPFKEFVISTELTAPSTHDLALAIAAAADSKKASNIVIVDMRGLVAYTDYLVIATGQTARQTKAIADAIRKQVKEDTGAFARRVEGDREADWVLMDFIDVVVHIFTPEAREFYRLDRLWRQAPQTVFDPDGEQQPVEASE